MKPLRVTARNIKIASAVVVGLAVVLGGFLIFYSNSSHKAPVTQQATSNIDSSPSYSGTEALINVGITNSQLNSLQFAFYKYSASIGEKLKSVAVAPNTVASEPHDRDAADPTFYSDFIVAINGKSYQARLGYTGLDDIRLYLKNGLGEQIFDSGTVNTSSSTTQ